MAQKSIPPQELHLPAMVVWDRLVAPLFSPRAAHAVIGVMYPVPEVVVLASPAPERIRESINLFELLHREATDSAKEFVVRKHVGVLVELYCEVARHLSAAVVVSVVLHEVIDVVKDQAVPVQILHGLFVAHVKQHCSIERLCAPLLYYIKCKLESLFLQHGHQVSQEDG